MNADRTEYQPYDDATQMDRQIPRYPKSFTRVPSQPPIRRPLTLTEQTGPTGLDGKFQTGAADLSRALETGGRAIGQLISVSGRITDEDGRPLPGGMIELWQANSAGKYIHEIDRHKAPLDPNFTGQGRILTSPEGEYQFLTIKPGAYPVLESGWWWRPPHIHFSIFGESWMDRYVTQIFFPGEPLNEIDLLLNGVKDPEARERLIFKAGETVMGDVSLIHYRLDFVLRGKRQTPELD
jgi:protocatechuate 3,4-dioxygenase beta subunit